MAVPKHAFALRPIFPPRYRPDDSSYRYWYFINENVPCTGSN